MTSKEKDTISQIAGEYFGACICYDECEQWKFGLLSVIKNAEKIKKALGVKNENCDR